MVSEAKKEKVPVDGRCSNCLHLGMCHFMATDEIGYYAFCMLERCECFIDIRRDDYASYDEEGD